jgi:hypothetical protein
MLHDESHRPAMRLFHQIRAIICLSALPLTEHRTDSMAMPLLRSPRASWPAALAVESTIDVAKASSTSVLLLDAMWGLEEFQELRERALQTDFIQGIENDRLPPEHYGVYMLQDSVYLARALVRSFFSPDERLIIT